MDNNIDNIDDLFREGFADYAETPPPAVWQAVERRLDNDKKRRVFPLRWFWYIGILVVAVVLGAGVLYMPEYNKVLRSEMAGDHAIAQLPAHETMAGNTEGNKQKEVTHTLPAKQDKDLHHPSTSATDNEIAAGGRENISVKKEKHNKTTAEHEGASDNKNKVNAGETGTTLNAAATGTSMYSYDDFEQEEANIDKPTEGNAPIQTEAGYVVSKKRKNKMVVVEMLPESVVAARKEEDLYASNSSDRSMVGKGVHIAKASIGNEAEVSRKKKTDVPVAETTLATDQGNDAPEQGAKKNDERTVAKKDANKVAARKVYAANTINKKKNAAPQKQNDSKSKTTESTNNIQTSVATSKKQVADKPKVASVKHSSNDKNAAKNATKNEERPTEKLAANRKNGMVKSGQQTDKSVTAATAKTIAKESKAEVKNDQKPVAAAKTIATEKKSGNELSDKREKAENKKSESVKKEQTKVAAIHKTESEKYAANKAVKTGKGSSNSEQKSDTVTHMSVKVADNKNERNGDNKIAANSAIVAKPIVLKKENDNNKKQPQPVNKDTKNEAEKQIAYKATSEKGSVNAVKKSVKQQQSGVAKNVSTKYPKAQHNAVATENKSKTKVKSTTNNTGATTVAPIIAAKTTAGNAKLLAKNKQNGVESEMKNANKAVGGKTVQAGAKSNSGKQLVVPAAATSEPQVGKWTMNSSLPDETNAEDYVVRNNVQIAVNAAPKVEAGTKEEHDSVLIVAKDSAVAATADSVKTDTTTRKKRWVAGMKAGVETGMMTGAANKAVVSPYLEYKFSERLSLMVQPALKMAGLTTRNVGNSANYYDVNPGTGSYKLTDSSLLILVLTGDTLWNRNYEYTERYDSIVKTNRTGGNYMEIELPLLLKYNVTKRLSVYGGLNTVYGKKMGVTEHTYVAKAMPKTGYVNTLAQYYAPAPAPVGTGTTYSGSPLSGYSGPQYPTETGGMFRFGYMFGLSYEVRKRWLADVLVQQCIAQQNFVAGYNVNRPLSVPYFRLTVGYRLTK